MDHLHREASAIAEYELPYPQKKPPLPFQKKAIILSGPTATGKTKLSLVIAKALGGEIISADSMQVYRGMDIGTAKASKEELETVPHHLIDIKDLKSPFNVVEFYERALETMDSIFSRNMVPILVGGTGFYIHTFLYGPPLGPPSDPKVRQLLEEDIEKFGPEPLYEKLASIDPEYAAQLTKGDKHKIVRALEIISISGCKVSDYKRKEAKLHHPNINFRCWFIHYPKQVLYPRIEMRCEEMLERGFLDEVKRLKDVGLENNQTASQAIGYKQALEYLKTGQSEEEYENFVGEFKKASRRYAKRQFTWFRKEPLFRWLNLESYDHSKAAELILHDFENAL